MAAPYEAPALAPPPGNPRFPLVDSIRAIAAGMILLLHVAGQVYGIHSKSTAWTYFVRFDLGVTIFFLISGFLLYRPFVAARIEGRPPIRLRDYARRRILRIVPAYWAALTLLALWPGLQGVWHSGWWRYYLFGQVYSHTTELQGIPVAWSLCVEASFYVLLPALAAGLAWLGRGARPERALRREIVALLALAAISIALQATAFAPSSGLVRSTLPVFMDWFALGMILAVLSVLWHRRQSPGPSLVARRPGLVWLAALVVFWFLATQLGLPRDAFNGISTWSAVSGHVFQGLCAVLLLAPALFGEGAGGLPRRLLANRALAWCGLVSYGVFLYHGPLIAKLREAGAETWIPGSRLISLTVVATAVSLALAAASYYVLERPLLRLKDRRARRAPASPATAGAEDTPSALVRG